MQEVINERAIDCCGRLDDRQDIVAAFVQNGGVNYIVAHDPRANVLGRLYGIRAIPLTYVIDKTGVVRFAHPGFPTDPNAAMAAAAQLDSEIRSLL